MADHHNSVLRRSTKRARELEPKLARVLEPILAKAGDEAARKFEQLALDHLTAAANTTPGVTAQSTMVAVYPRPEEAAQLDHQQIAVSELHCTLCFLGETEMPLKQLQGVLAAVAASHAPLEGNVAGIAAFAAGDEGHPAIVLPSVPGLVELRVAVTEALTNAGVDYSRAYGYVPHMTVMYSDQTEEAIAFPSVDSFGVPLHFDAVSIVRGNAERIDLPLTGGKPVTAAAITSDEIEPYGMRCSGCDRLFEIGDEFEYVETGDHIFEPFCAACLAHPSLIADARWSAPVGDEIIDAEALVKTLRTKTDPVRMAVIETAMSAALEGVGLEWDATNPFTAKVLAQSGSQIVNIAQSTQLNVMRIVRHAYEEGLSIPDTAKAIRKGMKEASKSRAILIARTELAGAVNGGSLAATQIVEQETGVAYEKTWRTADGAHYPRHEEYDGLDGQTVGLTEYFDVGGYQLQFPGDPDGPPEEVCNCRCTVVYVEAGVETEEDAG